MKRCSQSDLDICLSEEAVWFWRGTRPHRFTEARLTTSWHVRPWGRDRLWNTQTDADVFAFGPDQGADEGIFEWVDEMCLCQCNEVTKLTITEEGLQTMNPDLWSVAVTSSKHQRIILKLQVLKCPNIQLVYLCYQITADTIRLITASLSFKLSVYVKSAWQTGPGSGLGCPLSDLDSGCQVIRQTTWPQSNFSVFIQSQQNPDKKNSRSFRDQRETQTVRGQR